MWLRLGKWMEIGMHFGSQNYRSTMPDRRLVHIAVRFGTSEWHHGPVPGTLTSDQHAYAGLSPQPRVSRRTAPDLLTQPLLWR